jgi:hypothetical protein
MTSEQVVFYILLALVLGLLPAIIGKIKGYSFLVWWFLGAAFFIIAFPLVVFISSDYKKCPFCSEKIKKSATVCRFCQRELSLK